MYFDCVKSNFLSRINLNSESEAKINVLIWTNKNSVYIGPDHLELIIFDIIEKKIDNRLGHLLLPNT